MGSDANTCGSPMLTLRDRLREVTKCKVFGPAQQDYRRWAPLKCCIVAVEGGIAAGKTHLGNAMNETLERANIRCWFGREKIPDDLLGLFYAELDRQEQSRTENPDQKPSKNAYALSLQISMLDQCKESYNEALVHTGRKGSSQCAVTFLDRSIVGNSVFASMHATEGNIEKREYEAYMQLLQRDGPYTFDTLLYVDSSPETQHDRKKARARDGEKVIPVSYLRSLEIAYYTQLYYQVTEGMGRAIVVNNHPFVETEDVLDLLTDEELPELTRNFFRQPGPMPVPSDDLTNEDIRRGMDSLWAQVTKPRLGRRSLGRSA